MQPAPWTALHSIWRDDADRGLEARAEALLAKTRVDRWVWVVGDSSDSTEARLHAVAARDGRIVVLRADQGETGDDPVIRLRRMSHAGDAALAVVPAMADRVVIHESDLASPVDVVARLEGRDGLQAVAGWVTLEGHGFYDTWAYRGTDGVAFTNDPPYHDHVRPTGRFPVQSAGSVLSVPAWAIRNGARFGEWGFVGFCRALRQRGVSILVDREVPILQPAALWAPAVPAEVPAWT